MPWPAPRHRPQMITPHCESAYKSKQPLLMCLHTQVHIRSRLLNRLLALPIGDMLIIPCLWASRRRGREGPNSNLCPFFLVDKCTTFRSILQVRQFPPKGR